MKTELQKAIKELEQVSHTYIRKRDSINDYEIKGYCFDCGRIGEGQQFQCGHFEPSGSCGAILRFHPHNMHGQIGACNMKFQQEKVKIDYTFSMIKKYGKKRVEEIRKLKQRTIKADIIFYRTMIDLYNKGVEKDIVFYLEHVVK